MNGKSVSNLTQFPERTAAVFSLVNFTKIRWVDHSNMWTSPDLHVCIIICIYIYIYTILTRTKTFQMSLSVVWNQFWTNSFTHILKWALFGHFWWILLTVLLKASFHAVGWWNLAHWKAASVAGQQPQGKTDTANSRIRKLQLPHSFEVLGMMAEEGSIVGDVWWSYLLGGMTCLASIAYTDLILVFVLKLLRRKNNGESDGIITLKECF